MLDAATEALTVSAGRSREDLGHDRMLLHTVWHLVEIVGEAASHVSEEGRSEIPGIPWRIVVGMRHRLVHGYDTVDLDLLWSTVTEDLPVLVGRLRQGLEEAAEGTAPGD